MNLCFKNLFSPSSSNEETMYPVAHDWLHVDGSRVEPEDDKRDDTTKRREDFLNIYKEGEDK